MIAATHGQGMFALDVRQLQQLTPEVLAESVHLFEGEGGRLPSGGRGGFGRGVPQSAFVHYWLGAQAEVSLEIRDTAGQVIRTLAASGRAGLNRVEWSLDRGEGQGSGRFSRRAFVPAGTYTAVLWVDGHEMVTPLLVKASIQ